MYSSVELFSVALVKMAAEEDESCHQKISDTLHTLGCHHPEAVLKGCHDYLSQRTMVTVPQGVVILESMTKIIKDTIDQISTALAQKVISLATLWMTTLTGTQTDSQEAACNLLVAMSFRFINEVVQLTMENFKQGHLPHVYMVKTLSKMSTQNVYGMVPFLKSIMETMIPVLIGVKEDELKSLFASAMGSFSKSILNYLGNKEKVPDPTVTRKTFSTEINIVYSLLFKLWLEKEHSELNIPTVEALGYVSSLLPKDRLEEELPKLIRGLLSLSKKHGGYYSITECLRRVLEIATEMKCFNLKAQVDNVLNNLHQQICLSVDFINQLAMKNHIEILRCFTVLTPVYADALVDFLSTKLENADQQARVGTLSVLRHLISSVSSHLERKKAQIVAAVKPVLLDKGSNQEKKIIAQVICAMAQQGYLEPEGGKVMVEFLIRQCAAPIHSGCLVSSDQHPDQVTDEDVVTVCETVMFMITNTMKMEDILWPFLLECVTMSQYTKALTTICNCLTQLGKRKLQAGNESFSLPYKEETNLPKAQALLARLLIMSCCPYQGGGRGAAALRLLQVLSFNIHPAAVTGWGEELPSLTDHLLGNSEESLSQQEWEKKLLLLLSRTLNHIDDEEWTGKLSDEMCKQIHTNHHCSQEKGFLYKSLGTVLHHVPSKNIKQELHQMLLNVQHSESAEREGAAAAIGFCAMTHFDDTLSILGEFANSNSSKNTNNFFNILRDKPDVDLDKVRSTLVLCYGNMALYSSEELVLSRIESHILPAVVNQFITRVQGIKAESKDLTLKLSLIKTVTLIARSLQSIHQRVPFNFSGKRQLLIYMQELLEAEPPELLLSPVRQLAMSACMCLVQLHTDSNQDNISQLIQTCLASTFNLVPSELDKANDTNNNTKEVSTLYKKTMTALQELLKQILLQDLSPEGLQAIFKQVEEWIMSTKDYERERAMDTTLKLLKCYLETLDVKNAVPLNNMGTLIGRLMPRCVDPSPSIGQLAMDSLYIIMSIQFSYEGTNLNQHKEQLDVLKAVREDFVSTDSSVLFQTCSQITEVISNCLPHDQLGNLLFAVFKGLTDQHPNCSSAAAVLLKTIIKRRGSELRDQVSEILNLLRVQLQSVPSDAVRFSVLRSIAILTLHNTPTVVSCLLTFPVPLDEYVSDIWRTLAEETECSMNTVRELLNILNKQLPAGERKTYPITENLNQYSTLESLAAVCALYEMITTPETRETLIKLFPQLFSTLLIHHSSSINVRLPKVFVPHHESKQRDFSAEPQSLSSRDVCVNCVEMLMELLNMSNNKQVVHFMVESGGWNQMMDLRKSHRGVILLAKAMVRYASPSLTGIVVQLSALILTVEECQKVTVAAFFGELLKSPLALQLQLTDTLMNRLLRCLFNSSSVVQFLCVRGLSNVTTGAPHRIEKYSRPVLCAMTSLMETRENDNELLMFEVLLCLSKHLDQLRPNTIRPFVLKIISGIQPFFEAKCEKVRAEAFSVLGSLAKCGCRDPRTYFYRQIHSHLVCLLLHLGGNSKEVSRSCNSTLGLVIPLIVSAETSSEIEKHLGEITLNYTECLRDISKQLIKDFPDRVHSYVTDCISFFNNPQVQIRANAIALSAFFLQSPEECSKPAQRVRWWKKYKY
ncbi:maestro heat-like repeat-containing protein family member 1 [Carcharodon carcharias]|uniref:maestro heat-like repeat-containing protein family member 1 n=1 Tax=Carcharodon carcharias TaxID=13397 RepID=UPI001B7EDA54|nr:maestro heat-like repeat-containing protein family member 1 [Carcharodon carcharias]